MMRNRAGLLALAVLVVAILLMVFYVMPRIGGDAAKVGDAINQAGSEVKKTVAESAKTSRSSAPDDAETTQKVGRLASEAGQAMSELKALFADGKAPGQDVSEAARLKASTSLQTLADFAIPDGTNPVTAAAATKVKNGAATALSIIKALPENTADVAAAIAKAEAALTGSSSEPTAPANQPSSAASPAENKLPTFDVLRVEPDGSTVIAGSAEPNSKLEIIDGDKVVTTTEVGPTGDFAAVLDNPLTAGDHQIVLRATGKDGKASTSEEVATVSVPKDGNTADLLAMVSKPGTASRVIVAPKPGAQVASATPSNQSAAQADQASSSMDVTSAPAAASPPAAVDVMVSAVEIEGDKIFVAGMAKPSANVVAYADDKPIGKAKAGPDGHFVVDGVMPLAVGDHKIRVDVLDDTGKVAVRASVNFNRPEGNQVTVAAQGTKAMAGSPAAMVPLDEGRLGKLKSDAAKAFSLLSDLFADGKTPSAEQLAAARSANEFALRAIVEFRPAADATADFKQKTSTAAQSAEDALRILQALPNDAKSVGAALGKLGADIAQLTEPATAPAPNAPATNEVAGNQDGPTTIEQAPLAPSSETVIIRRGDTLWQISRRVYGAGVRYTTIYVANEDKIINPDRILPGQIFGLPKDALPNAEELHRKRLSGEHL
ncbi:nucleoid-associated protein YgaU/Sec-independent protein translocase protein TatA [Rhizobium mesoamericanum]|uniref:Ig-like domain-containing protein n=1 Tax=Rhizobium mesoamericanum TaxID=1079800 RepID=UPI002789A5FF|nr:Ig-like domain-containing protein [Rhizobium mesoamericanum]MDQ0562172.1 nucleoid-associated protein YgaU/Sec-independent protein translocase protein TatA [Rhizobium mesoamericanum]